MDNIEHIINTALQQIAEGKSQNEVVSQWPEHAKELICLIETAHLLGGLPKKAIPEPVMQRKYVLAPAKHLWLNWVQFSRFAAVSMSVVLLAAVSATTAYTAYISKPGDVAFEIKKAAEHLQVQLATSQEQKIQLQVEIAQKRLDDAQEAIQSSTEDPNKQAAALTELAKETTKTIDALNKAAQDSSKPLLTDKSRPLMASLDAITTKQRALLQDLTVNKPLALNKNILDVTAEYANKVAAIKDYLAAAANEESLTTLQLNPNAINATGTISQITYNTLTVNGETFTLTRDTVAKDAKGNIIPVPDLQLKQFVQILGDKQDGNLVARQITIVDLNGQVKGAETATGTTPSGNPDEKGSANSGLTGIPQPDNDPNTAIGTYIPEDPSPQTNFNE